MPRKKREEINEDINEETTENKTTKKKISHKNRGLKWEQIINNKLLEYRKQGICFLQKIPTEFTILRRGAQIVSAFPKNKLKVLTLWEQNNFYLLH